MRPIIEWYKDTSLGIMMSRVKMVTDEEWKDFCLNRDKKVNKQDMTKQKNTSLDDLLLQEFKSQESIYSGRYTKTALFLLRMIDLNLEHPLMKKYLYNAFLDDYTHEHQFKRPIFLLFRCKNFLEKEFVALTKVINDLNYKVWDYELGKQDGYHLTMIVCETPESCTDDYYHFKAGRYSKMSKGYKDLFRQHITDLNGRPVLDEHKKPIESLVWGILNKSETLKDKVAMIMSVKNDDGTIKDPKGFKEFREYLNTLEEIWDLPQRNQEYFLDSELALNSTT